MKALILDGNSKKDSDSETIFSLISDELNKNGFEVEKIVIRDKDIAPCQGCFDCWFKTPGRCRIADYGRETAEKILNSDLIIHFTPITFGGYSYELKKVMDRFIPKLLPFFTKRNGEIHHKYRCKKYGSIIAIGVLDTPDKEKETIFNELIRRNSLNMGAPVHKAVIFIKNKSETDFISEFSKILKMVEEKA